MKHDIYTNEHGLKRILAETEKIGSLYGLKQSDSGKLRLLAEEMLGLTIRLFNDLKYEFYIQVNSGERRFMLNLSAETQVKTSQKDKLLSLSQSGENKAAKGLLGKISSIFESLVMDEHEFDIVYIPHYDGMGMSAYFSLSDYRNEWSEKPVADRWDGLEKSIIDTIAEDLVIGVKSGKVEMVAVVVF
jgi:hypothetical protein